MQDNFERALSYVLRSEGGYSNDAHDPGGATMNGIIQREYDAWREKHGLARRPVRELDVSERDAIYRAEYWDAVDADNLPAGYDYCVFDAAVNSGVGRAKKWQAEVMSGEGHIDGVPSQIDCFCAIRLAFLKNLSTWRFFGGGWGERVSFVKRNATAMATGEELHDIAWVQAALNKLHETAPLMVDNVDGPATLAAVRVFQAGHGLAVDGCAGHLTVTAIEQALAA